MRFADFFMRPFLAGIAIVGAGAYIEVPGPHRALTPTAFGLEQISPGVYTDAPEKAPEIRPLIRKARTNSARFFGSNNIEPRYIICTKSKCLRDFDIRALGIAIGYHLVLIAPRGLNERTMTHERAHIDLHYRWGPIDLIQNKFPHWFDEGMASHVAGDNRLSRPRNPRDADWIRAAGNFSEWNAIVSARGPARSYGAAATLVDEIEKRIGRDGLKRFIDEVTAGADFNESYEGLFRR